MILIIPSQNSIVNNLYKFMNYILNEVLYLNIFYIIKNLCDKNKITIFELEKQIGVSRGILYTWKKSSPSVEKVKRVAEHFNISMDYLVNHQVEENSIVEISDEKDKKVIMKFLSLKNNHNKIKIEGLVDYFSLKEQERKDYEKEFIKILKSSHSIQMDIENENIELPKTFSKKQVNI